MIPDKDIDILADCYDGLSVAEIAKKHNLTRQGVYVAINRVKNNTNYRKGEKIRKPDLPQSGAELKPVFRSVYAGCSFEDAGRIAGISGEDAELAWRYCFQNKRKVPSDWKVKGVAAWLNRNDVTPAELADGMGMNREFLRRVLKGSNTLTRNSAERIAKYTGLTLEEVCGQNTESGGEL